MPEAPAREAAVWRDFRQAQGHALSRRVRKNPPLDTGIIVLNFLILLLIFFTDPVVWWGVPANFLFPVPPIPLVLASLFLLPLSGWLAQVRLTRWTPRDKQSPAWARALRFVAACLIPFGGLAIPPVWQELVRRNPQWIRPRGGDSASLMLRETSMALPEHPKLERIHRSEIFWLLLIIGSAAPLFMGSLLAVDPEGLLSRQGIITFNLGLHVIAFVGLSHTVRQLPLATGKTWTRLLTVGRWLLLFPSPILFVGLLLVAFIGFGAPRGTLIGRLYSLRSDALRFPLWRKTGEAFRPTLHGFSWADLTGRPRRAGTLPEGGRAAEKRAALMRLKLLFLPAESGLLAWLIMKNGGWQPRTSTLAAFLIAATVLALGAFFLQFLPGLAEKLRWDRIKPLAPYLRSGALLFPTAGCLVGILGGAGVLFGDIRLVGTVLQLLALFLSVFGLAYFIRVFATDRFDLGLLLGWSLLYASLELLGLLLEPLPDLADRAVFLVLAIPVLSLVAGLAFGHALLRPFTWRHIFEGQLPAGFRATLAIVSLTTLIPLGGLAIPFWIWVRQRLWPRYERTCGTPDPISPIKNAGDFGLDSGCQIKAEPFEHRRPPAKLAKKHVGGDVFQHLEGQNEASTIGGKPRCRSRLIQSSDIVPD